MIDTSRPETLLGTEIPCRCGKTHKIPLQAVIYDEEVMAKLSAILGRFTQGKKVALLADVRTWKVAGQRAEKSLSDAGWQVTTVIVPDSDHGSPICDDITRSALKPIVPQCDILLAVGGGVINDLTKWIAFELDLPYVVIATAASMNGYTAANVAPTLKGVKSLVHARSPVAALAEPEVIAEAPYELTASGLGDVIAKPISTADWIMNHRFFGEYFCSDCTELISAIEPFYFEHSDEVRERKPQAIESLYKALLYSGLAMTMVGTSAPASGGEHMLSHTLDMMSSVDGVPHDYHGRQVGLGTLFAAAIYEKLFELNQPKCVEMPADIDKPFWGKLAESVSQQYAAKQPNLKVMRERCSDQAEWKGFIDAVRSKVRSPREIKECLRKADAAHTLEGIHCSRDRFRAAVLHMHEIRKRCTVIDLAWTVGVLPGAADELIDKWFMA
jgi:glycerol-1-phosphate dehydrogenase [NAD(P)+]